MVQLLMLMLLGVPGQTGTGSFANIRERVQAATPVTDKFLLPPKIPDCRNAAEEERALVQRANGDSEFCDPVVHDRAMRRR